MGWRIDSERGSVEVVRELKKDVIWRWDGSEAAPAKGRLMRGVDIFALERRKMESAMGD